MKRDLWTCTDIRAWRKAYKPIKIEYGEMMCADDFTMRKRSDVLQTGNCCFKKCSS